MVRIEVRSLVLMSYESDDRNHVSDFPSLESTFDSLRLWSCPGLDPTRQFESADGADLGARRSADGPRAYLGWPARAGLGIPAQLYSAEAG